MAVNDDFHEAVPLVHAFGHVNSVQATVAHQPHAGEWQPHIEHVANELRRLARGSRGGD